MRKRTSTSGGQTDLPSLLTVREVIEFATIKGAKDNRLDQKIGTLTPARKPISSCCGWIKST
jgi:hypothetical protein